eukprot:TRINITY_DN24201_c0_g1_i1.p4 TRINITY_DN24201_c0_g1~~TRINITY_DN24201_c0_g1_i1.p4  ORF type:complete len:134 (+),score=25.89 TRINITY_DN24201_c0_g1_i1:130-531(+)
MCIRDRYQRRVRGIMTVPMAHNCQAQQQYQAYLDDLAARQTRIHTRHTRTTGSQQLARSLPARSPAPTVKAPNPSGLSMCDTPQDAYVYGRSDRGWMPESARVAPESGIFIKTQLCTTSENAPANCLLPAGNP